VTGCNEDILKMRKMTLAKQQLALWTGEKSVEDIVCDVKDIVCHTTAASCAPTNVQTP